MQALIGLTIFSDGSFDNKLHTLYSAFDDDGNESINRKELSLFIFSAIVSLCKIVGLPQPSRFGIQEYTYTAFIEVDKDGNQMIDYEEFTSWIKESDRIQDFLFKYTGIQTIERAKRRYREIFNTWRQQFDEVSVEFCGTKYAEVNALKDRLTKKMTEIPKDVRDKMFLLLSYEGQVMISEEDYDGISAPWAVFRTTDINNDNVLDISELKTLLWLYEGKEPQDARVKQEISLIDNDNTGTIDMLEWIQYQISPGEDGGNHFDYELRKKFDKFDVTKTGKLDIN